MWRAFILQGKATAIMFLECELILNMRNLPQLAYSACLRTHEANAAAQQASRNPPLATENAQTADCGITPGEQSEI